MDHPSDHPSPILGFIDPKVSIGSVILLMVWVVSAVGWTMTNVGQLADIKATVGTLQHDVASIVTTSPVQVERQTEQGRRIDSLEQNYNALASRTGALEQNQAGMQSDMSQLRSQMQSILNASEAPIRTPRR